MHPVNSDLANLACPLPLDDYPAVTLAHGGGGQLTQRLLRDIFLPAFGNPALEVLHDGAVVAPPGGRLALTTDSFVVRPLFFPGSNIGALAVNGTVNDLAMCGARPLYLTAGFILEEGLPMETLWRVAQSMKRAAEAAGVVIVTGDTKVVERGRGDGLYINTAGVGVLEHDLTVGPGAVRPGDIVLVSGDLGRHGMAVMAQREGLRFETTIESDCAPLWAPVEGLLRAGLHPRCLRDLTRGGLATGLIEIAAQSGLAIRVREADLPVPEEVAGACEILGLDPLFVANEGRFLALMPPEEADRALEVLRAFPVSAGAVRAGEVAAGPGGHVEAVSVLGLGRRLALLSGEQLPRIC
jgi:hydrogenase expression/formation protein HypE